MSEDAGRAMPAAPPRILLETPHLLIIDKPAGLPCHPSRAGGPSVETYFPGWRRGKAGPWLVHRLDQDTAGCLVIARRKTALIAAQALFAANAIEKTYWAAVRGVPGAAQGVVELALAKTTIGRAWRMSPSADGLPATTFWRVLGAEGDIAWLEFRPRTGRTHQIRAHAAAIGHPIIGDAVYGGGAGALQLLARHIHVPLQTKLAATAPVPTHMRAMLGLCGHAAQ